MYSLTVSLTKEMVLTASRRSASSRRARSQDPRHLQAQPDLVVGPTIPLESAAPEKTVAWLECSLPSCAAIGVGFEKATAALGWNLEVVSWSTDAAAAAFQRKRLTSTWTMSRLPVPLQR
jgi:hypothetical protein